MTHLLTSTFTHRQSTCQFTAKAETLHLLPCRSKQKWHQLPDQQDDSLPASNPKLVTSIPLVQTFFQVSAVSSGIC